MNSKSEIRKIYLEKRRELSPQQISVRSSEIAKRFFSQIDLSAVKVLHTFLRIAKLNEIDTSAIYFRIWRDHPLIRTFAPRLKDGTGEMESVEFDDAAELVENAWGIPEPAGAETADPNIIDLVIVPLLCFDEVGHRVGYGKGYYDRFLMRCRPDCLKVGLSLFPPLKLIDGVFESDVPLDICLTHDETYDFRPINEFAN